MVILSAVLLLTVDVGRLFSDWVVITNAAREGAYLASFNYYPNTPNQAISDAVVREGASVQVQPAEFAGWQAEALLLQIIRVIP